MNAKVARLTSKNPTELDRQQTFSSACHIRLVPKDARKSSHSKLDSISIIQKHLALLSLADSNKWTKRSARVYDCEITITKINYIGLTTLYRFSTISISLAW